MSFTSRFPLFRALRHRNYKLFFFGQGASMVGTWIQQVAEVWLMWRLTHSPAYLGILGFVSQFPAFLCAPFAGVWVDRVERRSLLIIAQVAAMFLSFVAAFLVFTNRMSVAWLLALGVLGGIVDALDIPARQSFVIDMVDEREDLGNAIALNSSLFNLARLIGPTIAGLLIALVGEGWCFFINGISFIGIVGALFAMHIRSKPKKAEHPGLWRTLSEGFGYALGFAPIWASLALIATVSLFGAPYAQLMSAFVAQVLHGGSHTLGFLTAASGLGAMLAALNLARRKSVLGLARYIPIGMGLFGLALALFSQSHVFWFSWICLVFVGFGMMTGIASTNTILQTIVDEDKRGRVMSFFTMAFFGMTPVGSLLQGWFAARIGTPRTILIGGVTCLLGALIYAVQLPRMRAAVRPIYRRLGILPEVAAGLQAATDLEIETKT